MNLLAVLFIELVYKYIEPYKSIALVHAQFKSVKNIKHDFKWRCKGKLVA